MTKFDYAVEKIQKRRYDEQIAKLNEELAFGLKTRTREEAFCVLKSALIAPSRVFDCFGEKQPANA